MSQSIPDGRVQYIRKDSDYVSYAIAEFRNGMAEFFDQEPGGVRWCRLAPSDAEMNEVTRLRCAKKGETDWQVRIAVNELAGSSSQAA